MGEDTLPVDFAALELSIWVREYLTYMGWIYDEPFMVHPMNNGIICLQCFRRAIGWQYHLNRPGHNCPYSTDPVFDDSWRVPEEIRQWCRMYA